MQEMSTFTLTINITDDSQRDRFPIIIVFFYVFITS